MTWDSAVAGGVVALGGKILWDWLSNGRKHNGNGNSAGAQNTAFWQLQYKESSDRVIKEVTECVQQAEARVMRSADDIIERQKRILDKVMVIEARRRTRDN